MTSNQKLKEVKEALSKVNSLELMCTSIEIDRFSKDLYNYSPILQEKLKNCIADIVVRPLETQAILEVATICTQHNFSLTIRGSGTGNYGQCVPLKGGVVMLMDSINNIRNYDFNTGIVTVESGCLLRDLNDFLFRQNRKLKLVPSSWRSASIGGFIAGGSGGIGSVRWGFLRDPGHLLALEVITLQEPSTKIQLDADKAEALNHAYGTNGIITALSITTAPYVNWQEVIIDCKGWEQAIKLQKAFTESAIELNLCCLIEEEIVSNLPKWFDNIPGHHRILVLVGPDGVNTLMRISKAFGAKFNLVGSEKDRGSKSLSELTWNHTTMHMRSVDSNWTYLQMLLPETEYQTTKSIKENWGEKVLWHLESVRQKGVQRTAALPLVKWKNREELEKLMNECKSKGCLIFNPHAITVEDGGLGVIDSDQVDAKYKYDSKGILNPGKLRGWTEKTNILP